MRISLFGAGIFELGDWVLELLLELGGLEFGAFTFGKKFYTNSSPPVSME